MWLNPGSLISNNPSPAKLIPVLYEGATVLYLGDADFSGGHIETNTRAVLEREVGRLAWERLAVADEQIRLYSLPVIQKYDARTKSRHDAVETEALSQQRIVDIVRRRLEALCLSRWRTFKNVKRRSAKRSPTCCEARKPA